MARLVNFTPTRGTGGIFQITPASFNAIEMFIEWAEHEAPMNIVKYMDKLVAHMALIDQMYSRKMSFGPYDPSGRNSALAWRTPDQGIRRITQNYYLGWKVKKVAPGWYRVFNNSKEAYFIEFGISQVGFGSHRHVPARRIRRPVRKLALLKTMKYMEQTRAYNRVWTDMFRSKHTSGGFSQIVQSPAGGHESWEDVTPHEAGGAMRGNLRAGRQMTTGLRNRGGILQRRVPNRGGGTYHSGGGTYQGPRLP